MKLLAKILLILLLILITLYAAGPRVEFEEVSNGLSESGVNYVVDTYGRPKMDVFGSNSNVFETMYCSDITILDDKYNMKMCGLEFVKVNDNFKLKFSLKIIFVYTTVHLLIFAVCKLCG